VLHFLCYKQVSVAPGGRWNKFKTYSTIRRSLEIWGFVITFLFKWWLNNQKFMYRGRVSYLSYFPVCKLYQFMRKCPLQEKHNEPRNIELNVRAANVARSERTVCEWLDYFVMVRWSD
jgi:hypothetical protein